MGVAIETVAARYPKLFHMAAGDAWGGIVRHGLLSTSALLDLFEITGSERDELEARRRVKCVPISHPKHGTATLRDQKPISDTKLAKSLRDGLHPSDWYRCLNEKVFFWVKEDRLETLLNAREYKNTERLVLVLETEPLLKSCAENVLLCPMNSGSTSPYGFPRGKDTFLRLSEYPFEDRRKRGLEPVVEVAVRGSVPKAQDHVSSAYTLSAAGTKRRIYNRK